MKQRRSVAACILFGTLIGLGGCGEGPDDSTRLNKVIDGGAPVSSGTIDTGILGNPTSYQPADFEPITAGPAGAAAIDESPEAAAVRKAIDRFYSGILAGSADEVMDAFPDEQIDALRNQPELLDQTDRLVDLIEQLWADAKEHFDADAITALGELFPIAKEMLVASLKIDMISEDQAVVIADPVMLQSVFASRRSELAQRLTLVLNAIPADVLASIPGASGEASTADSLLSTFEAATAQGVAAASASGAEKPDGMALRKIDGNWKIDVGFDLTEEQADAVNAFVSAVVSSLEDLADQFHEAAGNNATTDQFAQIVTAWAGQTSLKLSMAGLALQPAFANVASAPTGAATADAAADAGAPVAQVSFTNDIMPLIEDRCTSCHRPGGRAERRVPLNLEPAEAYTQLVNQHSSENSDLIFVVPGDADASFLYEKLASASPQEGHQMPAGDEPLSEDELKLFRDWILGGALNDGADKSADDSGDESEDAMNPRSPRNPRRP